jgi:uncharacterized protein (TIGR01777 family)
MSRNIVLPGGSGFIGKALAEMFSRDGWEVVILSRRAAPPRATIRTVFWDGRTAGPWSAELDGADAVINLAGRSIGCLHTPENRRQILESRVASVRAIEAAVAQCRRPPAVLVQASAIGFYGNSGYRICDETSPAGTDFLAGVTAAWESDFWEGKRAGGPRRVVLRNGHILGRNGGLLAPLARLTRCFLGGAAGSGRQYLSWLHLADYHAVCQWIIARPECSGVYNACGPAPVTNAAFMRELRKALHRPWSPPAPAWAAKQVARWILRVDPSLALAGCRAVPRHLLAEGFVFRHAGLAPALRDLLGPANIDKPLGHFHA